MVMIGHDVVHGLCCLPFCLLFPCGCALALVSRLFGIMNTDKQRKLIDKSECLEFSLYICLPTTYQAKATIIV